MNGYFISLTANTLKIGLYVSGETPKFISEELLPTIVSHSRIVDATEFAKEFSQVLAKHFGNELPKLPLFFVLEPEVTELFLLTTSKNCNDADKYCLEQIKDKLAGKNIDDLFYAFYKIAPFIYQFVGVRRDALEPFMETANILKLEVGGIFPWGLILPKTNNDISSIFIFPNDGENIVVFSELTGVTFAEKLEGKLSLAELKELFYKLSVYNNKQTDLNVYTFAKCQHSLGTHKILSLDKKGFVKDFEEIGLTQDILEKCPAITISQANLLNLLPIPESAAKSNTPAIVAASAISIFVVVGLVLQLTVGLGNILRVGKENQDVLAKHDQAQVIPEAPTPTTEPQTPQKEIKRTDLKIRVENGNGIPGSAGKLKTYLEGFGYTVVSVGNAATSDYTKTLIKLPKDFVDYKDLLTNDLKTNYSVEINNVDSKSADYDILIIAGLN